MKSRDTIMRLKRFQVDEKRRRVAQIEMMIADFDRMATDLEREIALEEQRAGISDKGHFAYPTYARAAMQRKENLVRSADELRVQLTDARRELEEAFEELKKFEILDDREQAASGQPTRSASRRRWTGSASPCAASPAPDTERGFARGLGASGCRPGPRLTAGRRPRKVRPDIRRDEAPARADRPSPRPRARRLETRAAVEGDRAGMGPACRCAARTA